mmetsp:Transcript_32533/g.80918  ORF Transcript_32533/g.80918 Transcript_32533/m.80918 type:complete len:98 (+) Transcript_32533:1809-2102(+)
MCMPGYDRPPRPPAQRSTPRQSAHDAAIPLRGGFGKDAPFTLGKESGTTSDDGWVSWLRSSAGPTSVRRLPRVPDEQRAPMIQPSHSGDALRLSGAR